MKLIHILGQDKTAWMFWNWVKAEEFSAFGSSSGFLESSLWLWCPCFYGLIKRAKSWEVCRGKRLRLRCAPRSVPWLGRGACTLKSGPGTRRTISSCQSGSSWFKGSSCQVSSRTLLRPSDGCRLRSIVKICLLLSIPGRADPAFSKLFMEAFWDTFAKHGMTQYSCLPLLSSWFDY